MTGFGGAFLDGIIQVLGGLVNLLRGLGGVVAVVFLIYAGYLFMSSAGDPQKDARAKGAVIGVVVGLVLIGTSYMVPEAISDTVIEPAGGEAIVVDSGRSCDQHLRRRLGSNPQAYDVGRVQRVIVGIQTQVSGCNEESWSPLVHSGSALLQVKSVCGAQENSGVFLMSGVPISQSLFSGSAAGNMKAVARNSAGDIFLIFDDASPPGDGSRCWYYSSSFNAWMSGG